MDHQLQAWRGFIYGARGVGCCGSASARHKILHDKSLEQIFCELNVHESWDECRHCSGLWVCFGGRAGHQERADNENGRSETLPGFCAQRSTPRPPIESATLMNPPRNTQISLRRKYACACIWFLSTKPSAMWFAPDAL